MLSLFKSLLHFIFKDTSTDIPIPIPTKIYPPKINIEDFIKSVEIGLGDLRENQKVNLKLIIVFYLLAGEDSINKLSYIVATSWHESRLKVIKEIRAKQGTKLRTIQNNYWDTGYYGRGLVQLTWKRNYRLFQDLLKIPLEDNPELVLLPCVSAEIIVRGMLDGLFTGVSLNQFITDDKADFLSARKVVNGNDKAELIQKYTLQIIKNVPNTIQQTAPKNTSWKIQ